MRFLAWGLVALMLIPVVRPAVAGEQSGYSEYLLKLKEQVRQNQDVFSKVTAACLNEAYADPNVADARARLAVDQCIRDMGIDVSRTRARTPGVTRMGRPGTAENISYQIPDIDAVMRKLQGGGASPRVPQQGSGQLEKSPQPAPNREKSSSSGGQIYLPSNESEGSAKPIFLNR